MLSLFIGRQRMKVGKSDNNSLASKILATTIGDKMA
jgi:hypothetical protein